MTSEQRQRRAERNRRYYQRRRSVEQTGEEGDAVSRSPASPHSLEASETLADRVKTGGDLPFKTHEFAATGGDAYSPDDNEKHHDVRGMYSASEAGKTIKTQENRTTQASESKSFDHKTQRHNEKWRLRRSQIAALILLLSLVIAITFCLVNEAYRYYMQHDPAMALLKALIGELILLYLALLAPKQWFCWLMVKGLMLVTFGYLVWIISMGLLLSASGDVNKLTQTKAMIGDVEQQIEDKRNVLGELTKSGWLSRARKIDEQLTMYQQRLFELRSSFAQLGDDQEGLVVANMTSLVLFRVILMLTNVVLMGRIRSYCAPINDNNGALRGRV